VTSLSSARGLSKAVFAVLAICALIVVAVVLRLNFNPAENVNSPLPSRESAVPEAAVKMSPSDDIFPPILHSDEWNQPVPLPGGVNTAGGEDSAFVMPDGKTLYFFFTPNVTIPVEKQVLDGVTGIYVSQKQDNGSWGEAARIILQDSGKLALDGAEFVQGNTMWFASAREGDTGVNLFTAEFKDGKWTNWQYVGDKIMKDYQVGEMHITADGNTMYFHSGRAGGKGGLDIWVTQKVNGEWQTPMNVESVNTAGDEGWPFVTQDGNELWFTRTHMGSPAIYRSIKTSSGWSEPQLILSQFTGESSLDNERNIYFTHHFYNKASQMIEADIYVAYKK
jgi:hypothetical protein